METYSPFLDEYQTGDLSEFHFDLDFDERFRAFGGNDESDGGDDDPDDDGWWSGHGNESDGTSRRRPGN